MKTLLRMTFCFLFIGLVGVVIIKLVYGCSWSEAVDIAENFVSEVLS